MKSYIANTKSSFQYFSSTVCLFFLSFTAASTQGQFVNAPFKTALSSFNENTGQVRGISDSKSVVFDLKSSSSIQEASVIFDKNSSEKVGFEDQTFFKESDLSLSTMSADNVALAVNSLPPAEKIAEIDLSVNAEKSQKLSLSVKELAGVEDWGIILTDTYLNKEVDLKVDKDYTFDINKEIEATFGSSRFKLTFIPPASSPIYAATSFSPKKSAADKFLSESLKNEAEFKREKAIALTK